jgi:hypothetical protein
MSHKEDKITRLVLIEKKPLTICVITTGDVYEGRKCKHTEEAYNIYLLGNVLYPINFGSLALNLDIADYFIIFKNEKKFLVSKEICIKISE